MNNEKISNEMADKLADIVFARNYTKGGLIRCWKEAELIEESELEKARRLRAELSVHLNTIKDSLAIDLAHGVYCAYERVAAKLEARIKELEDGK